MLRTCDRCLAMHSDGAKCPGRTGGPVRLLHLGDIHPNNSATFAGKTVLDTKTGLNQALTDLRQSLLHVYNYVTQDPETRCHAALITGDLFDSPRPHANEVRIITDFVQGLADEMPVLIIAGNHDISTNPNDATALECLSGIPHVFLATTPRTELIDLNGQLVRFCCLPYPTKGRLLANTSLAEQSPEQVTAIVNQCLADILRGFTAECEPGIPRVLLAHGSVSTAKVGDQPRSLAHDILIPLDVCEAFDYVALGHIHQPQQVAPNAWYSGSLMRNGFGEEREEKGFNVVEIDVVREVTFVPNPHARVYQTIASTGRHGLPDEVMDGQASLSPDVVWRFKDQLNAGDYEELKPLLDRLQAETPFLQLDVELLSEDRPRDAGMAKCLTMDEALARALGDQPEAERTALFDKHQQLVREVAA